MSRSQAGLRPWAITADVVDGMVDGLLPESGLSRVRGKKTTLSHFSEKKDLIRKRLGHR
jgi:hypothetical protein